MKKYISIQEVKEHIHPILENPDEYQMVNISFDIDQDSQSFKSLRLTLRSKSDDRERKFKFEGISFPGFGSLQLPRPFGTGIYIVDIRYRQWAKKKIEVLQNYEELPELFWCESVEEVT